MRKPSKSIDQITTDLARVFRTHGFHGASLTKLTEGTGLERASLYHHFPKGKVDMAEAVLIQAIKGLEEAVIAPLSGSESANVKIKNMLKAISEFYSQGNEVCFITIFSIGDGSPKIASIMKDAIKVWVKSLQRVLTELEIEPPKESAQRAISTIQGSLILSSSLQDNRVFKACIKSLKNEWLG